MAQWTFINDDFIREEESLLHFRDLATMRAYGIFDFVRVIGGRPVFLNDHLDRFYFSAEQMRLQVPFGRNGIKDIIRQLVEKNEMSDTGVRITLTGGYSTDGYHIAKPNLIISLQGFVPPDAGQLQKGVRLISHEHQRQLPHIKSIDYLMAIWLQPLVKESGADDVLYHMNGRVSECPRSNIFMVTKERQVITPGAQVLKGVMRSKIIQEAGKLFEVQERPVSLEELKSAAEVFITSTTKLLLPVVSIDDAHFGAERPVTQQIFDRVQLLIGEESKQAVM